MNSWNITWNSGLLPASRSGCSFDDQQLERHVLMRVGARARLRESRCSSFAERRLAGQVGAQHQRVDEEPDQALELAAVRGPAIGTPTTMSR